MLYQYGYFICMHISIFKPTFIYMYMTSQKTEASEVRFWAFFCLGTCCKKQKETERERERERERRRAPERERQRETERGEGRWTERVRVRDREMVRERIEGEYV